MTDLSITANIDTNFLVMGIILLIGFISLKISLKSSGIYKSMIALTGVLSICFGIIWHGMIENYTLSYATIIILTVLDSFFYVAGFAMVYVGVANFFKK